MGPWLRLALRGVDIGQRARFLGTPHIRARGAVIIGDDFVFRSLPVKSHLVVDAGARLQIGDGVAFEHGASVSCSSEITIGDGARFGAFTTLLDLDYHEVNDRAKGGVPKPIRIGEGVRLGARVTVLRGAMIGEGAVIEPGSTVSRAIPPHARAGGVPARVLGDVSLPHDTGAGDLGEIVPRAVMEALHLSDLPQLSAARRLFPSWDRMAAAQIASLLEDELGQPMPREAILEAKDVHEILLAVSRALFGPPPKAG